MLALLNSLRAPGLDYISLYPDHMDPYQFYYFKTRPRIATDAETQTPLLSFMMIGRNVDKAVADASGNEDAADLQLGTLNMTVDLGLNEEEEKGILNYLSSQVNNSTYRTSMKLFYPKAYEIFSNDGFPYNPKIKLTGVGQCMSGTSRMELLEGLGDSFKRTPCQDISPSLAGNFSSSFYATFGPEGAQLMYDALKKGYTNKEGNNVSPAEMLVRYNMKVPAYVPPLKARLKVNVKDVYKTFQEVGDTTTITDFFTKDTVNTGKGADGNFTNVWTNGRVYLSDVDIEKEIKDSIDKKKGVTLDIEDYSEFASSEADRVTEQLLSSLITLVTSTVIPSLFDPAPLTVNQNNEVVKPEDAHKDDNAHTVTHMVYKLKDEVNLETVQDIEFNFSKSGSMQLDLVANGLIISSIPSEQLDSLVKIVDISDPVFKMMSIPIAVNALFEEDKIFCVDVEVKYEQRDATTGLMRKAQKAYQFKNEKDIYQFRTGLAKDSQGKDIRTYQYRTRITYRGQGTSVKSGNGLWTEWITSDATSIVVSYERLGFLKVQCSTADMDWDVIQEAIVSLEYPSGGSHSDCKIDLHLSRDNQVGNWTCFKWGSESSEYYYQVKYINRDGTEMTGSKLKDTKSSLVINDLLSGRMTTSFDVIMSSQVAEKVKVEVLYTGIGTTSSYYHWFTGTDTWDLTFRLQDKAPEDYKYRYLIQYVDGNTELSDWKTGHNNESQTLTVNKTQTTPISLIVDGGNLDWTKWRIAYVNVRYVDEDHAIDFKPAQAIRISQDSFFAQVDTVGYIGSIKPFLCSATLVSAEPGKAPVQLPEVQITNGLFLLENPAEAV